MPEKNLLFNKKIETIDTITNLLISDLEKTDVPFIPFSWESKEMLEFLHARNYSLNKINYLSNGVGQQDIGHGIIKKALLKTFPPDYTPSKIDSIFGWIIYNPDTNHENKLLELRTDIISQIGIEPFIQTGILACERYIELRRGFYNRENFNSYFYNGNEITTNELTILIIQNKIDVETGNRIVCDEYTRRSEYGINLLELRQKTRDLFAFNMFTENDTNSINRIKKEIIQMSDTL